jgi:hypothetical protein
LKRWSRNDSARRSPSRSRTATTDLAAREKDLLGP